MDMIYIWFDDRYRSNVLFSKYFPSTIPPYAHDLKAPVHVSSAVDDSSCMDILKYFRASLGDNRSQL